MKNPFAMDNFGASNPQLNLITDPDVKKQMQRQAMFKGLGNAGAALLNNTTASAGKAFGAGANAFNVGASESVNEGLMVDKERKAILAETQRQARLQDVKKHLGPMDQQAYQVALDTDNKAVIADLFKKSQREGLIADINASNFTPKSVEAFRASVDAGKPDYGVLISSDGAGGSGSGSVSLYNLLYKQATGQYGKIDPQTGEFLILEGRAPEMQDLYTEAARLIATGQANIGNAISIAGTKQGIVHKDLSKTKPNQANTDFDDLEE